MNITTLKTTLYTLLDPLFSETIIWADQSAPRPALPYISLKLGVITPVGESHYSDVDANGIQTVSAVREAVLNVQRFGTDSVSGLETFSDNLKKNTVLDLFSKQKISAFNVSDVTDISTLQNGIAIEPRASVDVSVRWTRQITDTVGIIQTVISNTTSRVGDIGYTIEGAPGDSGIGPIGTALNNVYQIDVDLMAGTELVENGRFSNGTTGWTNFTSTTSSVISGELVMVAPSSLGGHTYQNVDTVVGVTYEVTGTIRNVTGDAQLFAQDGSGAYTVRGQSSLVSATSPTAVSFTFVAGDTSTSIQCRTESGLSAGFDDLSVRVQPPELVTNGDFSSGVTGWIVIGATPLPTRTAVGGELQITAGGGASPGVRQGIPTQAGKTYQLSGTFRRGTTERIISIGVSGGATTAATSSTANVDASFVFVASAATTNVDLTFAGTPVAGGTAFFDNISVKELTPELLTNGDFSSGTTGWVNYLNSSSVSSGELIVVGVDGFVYQTIPTVIGKMYEVNGTARRITGDARISARDSSNPFTVRGQSALVTATSPTAIYFTFIAQDDYSDILFRTGVGLSAGFDNVSVIEVAE